MSINKLYKVGEDALQNLFDINFGSVPLPNFDGIVGDWAIRASGFEIPESGVEAYEVHYKTSKIERVSGKGNTPLEFSLDIRVDRYWTIYKALTIWKNAMFGTWDNKIGPDYLNATNPLNLRVPITVKPASADGDSLTSSELGGIATAWTFMGCFPKSVGSIGFDYSGGEPLTVSVTFGTLGMKDFLA